MALRPAQRYLCALALSNLYTTTQISALTFTGLLSKLAHPVSNVGASVKLQKDLVQKAGIILRGLVAQHTARLLPLELETASLNTVPILFDSCNQSGLSSYTIQSESI